MTTRARRGDTEVARRSRDERADPIPIFRPGPTNSQIAARAEAHRARALQPASEPKLPPGCPPRIPKDLTVVDVDTRAMAGELRDRWRAMLGTDKEHFEGWNEINRVVSSEYWRAQLEHHPRVEVQPDPGASSPRARAWLGLTAEFHSCEQVSSGPGATFRGVLAWNVEFDRRAEGTIVAGWVDFTLPAAELDRAPDEETHATPTGAYEGPPPGRPDVLPPPMPEPDIARAGVEGIASIFMGAGLPKAIGQLMDQSPAAQLYRDITGSIWQSTSHAPEILERFWAYLQVHWYDFIQTTATLISAEIGVGVLVAAPDPTMTTKIAAAALQALLIFFLLWAVKQEGEEVHRYANEWWDKVRKANGDPGLVDEAARAFCFMVFHFLMAATAAATAAGKASAFKTSAPGATAGEVTTARPGRQAPGREVAPTEPKPVPAAPAPGGARGGAGRSAELSLQDQEAIEWARQVAASTPEELRDPALIEIDRRAYAERQVEIQKVYEEIMRGDREPPPGVTREKLRRVVEGDPKTGERIPLTFPDEAIYREFQAELRAVFESEGITDAVVQQVGSATKGFKGNPKKPFGPWSPESDADFAVFSAKALGQAKDVKASPNPKVHLDGRYTVLRNSVADGKGFYDTGLGRGLRALAEKWRSRLWPGQADADGMDFKLNLTAEPFSGAITVLDMRGGAH